MKKFIFVFLFCLCAFDGHACTQKSHVCTEGAQTKVIEGRSVTRDCWKYDTKYECLGDDYKDYCASIRSTPGCVQLSSDCKETSADGKCLEFSDSFQCGNLLATNTDIVHLDTEYTISRDELDTTKCSQNELNDNCQEVANVCTEGAETRNINGKDIYKDCWRYEKKYSCFNGSFISDCEGYEKCKLLSEQCFNVNKAGVCVHKEKQFECIDLQGQKPVYMNCKNARYCIGEHCEEKSYKKNQNMNKAVAALSMLNGMKKEFETEGCSDGNKSNCKVFKGEGNQCEINPISSLNCCKDKGWLKGLKLAQCNEEEKQLAKRKEAGLCHHVGSYCADRLLGVCIAKKQSYCCFQSKLSRIIHEQGRGQLGISWGGAKSPDCRSLTIEELQRINFDKVDLSEIYGQFLGKVSEYNHEARKDSTQGKVKETLSKAATKQKTIPGSPVSNAEYQEEIARRVKQHYGN